MSDPKNAELAGIIEKQLMLTERLFDAVNEAMSRDVQLLGRTGNAAVMVSGLMENYYTCLETAYQKISQHFENHLDPARWHADLLAKMTVRIAGVRIPAVSDAAYGPLVELQRFRHFRRYYFDVNYDWDRVEFVLKKLRDVHPLVRVDLERFREFLLALNAGADLQQA